jgi:hypothetical protein
VRAPPVTTAAKDRRSRLRSAAYSVGASFAIPPRDGCEAFFLFLLFYCIISKLINAQNPARGLGGVRGAFLIIAVKKKNEEILLTAHILLPMGNSKSSEDT